MDMKEYNFTIVRDEKIYPPITLPSRTVKNYLTAISKSHTGYAVYLEAKFLEYARILHNGVVQAQRKHNGVVANSRTKGCGAGNRKMGKRKVARGL